MKNLLKINSFLIFIARILSGFGSAVIMLMIFLIVLDVILRYIFNSPIMGIHEVIEHLLLLTLFFFITDCWNAGTHIRMGLVYEKTGRFRPLFDAIIGILSVPLFGFLAWKVMEETVYAISSNQISAELLFPIWPFKLVVLLCLLLFILQLAISIVIPPHLNHGKAVKEQQDQ